MTTPVRPPDADIRDRIIRTRDQNISVEAGAGTGKTTLLVERVASMLSTGTPMGRLAIITFTRKAASELGSRLRRRLGEAVEAGEVWAASALADIDRAAIGTTDSFCRSILADFPLEAGLPPGFTLVDEIAQGALLETAWERRLDQATDDDQSLFERLREVGVRPDALRSLGAEMADQRDLSVAPIEMSEAEDLIEIFARSLAPAVERAGGCTDPTDLLLERVRSLEMDLRVAEAIGGAAAERTLLRLRRGDKKYATKRGRAASWGGADGKAAVVDALTGLDEAVDRHLQSRGAELALRVGHWLTSFVAEYQRLKRERGLVDFRDLALETRRLLVLHPGLRRLIASRWDAVLLDEVQDTDPLQMEIAFLLAGAGGSDPADASDDADPKDPLATRLRPGGLFLVGDPKQSIYRFRRADIELYERARSKVAERGQALSITANFRSHPTILRFVNVVFDGWMEPPPGETWQARYEGLQPGRPPAPGDEEPRTRVLLPDPQLQAALMLRARTSRLRSHERAELEIDAAVRLVRAATGLDGGEPWTVIDPDDRRTRPAKPGDVAVLVRKIAWGDRLADALRQAGVPANVSGGKRFQEREEIRTLAMLLDTVLDPQNRLARFAALRSPVFALSDDDLVRRFDPGDVPAESTDRLADAEQLLDRLGDLARELPVPEFLERLTEETALLAAFGFRPDGPGRVEALRLLVEAADSLAEAGFDTLPKFVSWLKTQDSSEGRSVFGELDPGSRDSVEILTMHKAKGLEFPIVLLADLGSAPAGRSPIVCDRIRRRIEFRLPGAKYVATPDWETAAEQEKIRANAEEVRLLYVAMTRARDHLVLSWPEGRQGFLADLPQRLDVAAAAGEAVSTGEVLTIRAGDLAAVPEAARLHGVDPESAIRDARASAAPALPFVEPSEGARKGDPTEQPTRRRILAATVIARESLGLPPWSDEETTDPNEAPRDSPSNTPNPLQPNHFGSLVHKCLEILPLPANGAWAPLVDEAWGLLEVAGGFGPFAPDAVQDARERAEALLIRLETDPEFRRLSDRMAAAPSGVLREVPFLVPQHRLWVSGTLDALFDDEDGGWTVVDYKTGAISAKNPAASAESHRPQAALYAWAARRAGIPVRDVVFLFLGANPAISVSFEVDEAFLAAGQRLTEEAAQ